MTDWPILLIEEIKKSFASIGQTSFFSDMAKSVDKIRRIEDDLPPILTAENDEQPTNFASSFFNCSNITINFNTK